MAGFQTKKQLKELLDNSARHPRKRYGQHFLIDRNLMQKLIEAAELCRQDQVLEVGTGTGSLTAMLAEHAGRVVTSEIDVDIAAIAREQLAAYPNIEMILGDALETKSRVSPRILQVLGRGTNCGSQIEDHGIKRQETIDSQIRSSQSAIRNSTLKLVANLPYDIATVLVVNLLMSELPFSRMCFTVQAEVANRFLARENSPDYGPISILTSIMTRPQKICRVPPQAFWPEPKVDSTMLRLDVYRRQQWPVADMHAFAMLVRSFFQKRRKTIGHIAKNSGHPGVSVAITNLRIDLKLRPENIPAHQWAELFNSATVR